MLMKKEMIKSRYQSNYTPKKINIFKMKVKVNGFEMTE